MRCVRCSCLTRLKYSDFLVQLSLRIFVLGVFVHEYGHLIGLRLLGVPGEIRSTMLNAVYPSMSLYGIDRLIFYGAGGAFQALVSLILIFRCKDFEIKLANIFVATHGLIYGAIEATAHRSWWGLGSMLGSVAGVVVVLYLIVVYVDQVEL